MSDTQRPPFDAAERQRQRKTVLGAGHVRPRRARTSPMTRARRQTFPSPRAMRVQPREFPRQRVDDYFLMRACWRDVFDARSGVPRRVDHHI